MNINESAENYLETILILSQKLSAVRSIDIATALNYSKPSVSVAEAGYITLTKSGKEIADMIYERHELFTSWLISLGVDEKTASEDACRMEHVISKESFEAIKNHIPNCQK